MSILTIITKENEILSKKSADVVEFDENLRELISNMSETMYSAHGVGLAAPQVGILRNIIVIDVGDGLIELVNPKITHRSGRQRISEGCLSCPGEHGITLRPRTVQVRGFDRFGKSVSLHGSNLKAAALCHEIDHLFGILFTSRLAKI